MTASDAFPGASGEFIEIVRPPSIESIWRLPAPWAQISLIASGDVPSLKTIDMVPVSALSGSDEDRHLLSLGHLVRCLKHDRWQDRKVF